MTLTTHGQLELDTGGPQLAWPNIGKVSVVIRTLRAVRDIVEEHINPYRRYKRHCAPDAEDDINRLVDYYKNAQIFGSSARKLPEADQAADFVLEGSDTLISSDWMEKWATKCTYKYSEEQMWDLLNGEDG
jgi:hypothetical protein